MSKIQKIIGVFFTNTPWSYKFIFSSHFEKIKAPIIIIINIQYQNYIFKCAFVYIL